jgi:hypothetical protein
VVQAAGELQAQIAQDVLADHVDHVDQPGQGGDVDEDRQRQNQDLAVQPPERAQGQLVLQSEGREVGLAAEEPAEPAAEETPAADEAEKTE